MYRGLFTFSIRKKLECRLFFGYIYIYIIIVVIFLLTDSDLPKNNKRKKPASDNTKKQPNAVPAVEIGHVNMETPASYLMEGDVTGH